MFLLGAGASVEAGIPDAYKITEALLNRISANDRYETLSKILRFVVGGLLFQQGAKGMDPFHGVNVEDLFNAVILLGNRQNSELGPFIGSWHPKLSELESGQLSLHTSQKLLAAIRGSGGPGMEELLSELMDLVASSVEGPNSELVRAELNASIPKRKFDSALTAAIREVTGADRTILFALAAEILIRNLKETLWLKDPGKANYLLPLVTSAKERGSFIATLNYDNTIELIGQSTGIPIDTGFESWSDTGEFAFDASKLALIKLHGSIDWALFDVGPSEEKVLPYQIITRVDLHENLDKDFRPAVVFGGNKLTAKGPFLSLLRAFENQISDVNELVTIGYSFRDEHINEFISKWFNGSSTRTLRIVDPKLDQSVPFVRSLLSLENTARVLHIKSTASEGILAIVNNS